MRARDLLTTLLFTGVLFLLLAGGAGWIATAGEVAVSVVSDPSPGAGASHGLRKIMGALESEGISAEQASRPAAAKGKILIVAGLSTGAGPAALLAKTDDVPTPTGAEALVIRHTRISGKPALLLVGSDDRGLMYAELDAAERIGWAEDPSNPLSEVRNAIEKPFMPERSLIATPTDTSPRLGAGWKDNDRRTYPSTPNRCPATRNSS